MEKVLWKYSLRRVACKGKFSLSCLQPSDISSHSKDPFHSSYYPRGKCFLWTLCFSSEAPQVVEPVYNERGMLEWLRVAPYSSGTDYIPEPEVVYQMKQNWRKWTSLVSFRLGSLSKYFQYILKQRIVLNTRADWLDRQTLDILCYLRPSNSRENGVPVCSRDK